MKRTFILAAATLALLAGAANAGGTIGGAGLAGREVVDNSGQVIGHVYGFNRENNGEGLRIRVLLDADAAPAGHRMIDLGGSMNGAPARGPLVLGPEALAKARL